MQVVHTVHPDSQFAMARNPGYPHLSSEMADPAGASGQESDSSGRYQTPVRVIGADVASKCPDIGDRNDLFRIAID